MFGTEFTVNLGFYCRLTVSYCRLIVGIVKVQQNLLATFATTFVL